MASSTVVSPQLLDQVTCGICSEVLYQPVALLDCLHVFCGSCLVPWLAEHATCPSCRATIRAARDSHSSNSLIDVVLSMDPSLKRTPEECEEARQIYRHGTVIPIEKENAEDEDEYEEEVYTEDEPEMTVADYHLPCPACRRDNDYNYTCSQPIPDPRIPSTVNERIPRYDTAPGHVDCHNCERYSAIPKTAENTCSVCRISICLSGFGTCPLSDDNAIDYRRLCKLKDFRIDGEPSLEQIQQWFPGAFSFSRDRQAEMARTLRARHPPMFLPDLCGSIVTFGGVQGLQRPSWMGAPAEALGEKTFVSGDDYVCDICARGVLEENVKRWWQHERQSSHSLLEPMRHFHISEPPAAPPVHPSRASTPNVPIRSGFVNRVRTRFQTGVPVANRAVSPGNSVSPRIAPTRTRWRLRKTDPFPHISPQFASSRDLHGRPLFLTIVEIQSGRHPGKAGSHLGPGVTAYGGQERYCDDGASYEILLEEPGMKWVNTSHGKVPDGARAVAEGRDGDGSPLYFAAAWIRGHRVLGKTGGHLQAANVPWGGGEHLITENYNILVWA